VDRILDFGAPVMLSTGMSPLSEIDAAVARVQARGLQAGVLQCTTAYPCPPEKVGLNLIPTYRERYGCWVGLSDHSATIYPGLAGAAIGLDLLEVHVTLSREMFGPDVIASITTAELRQLVDGVRFIERMRAHPVDKDAAAAETAPLRRLFTRSLVAREALPAGTVLGPEHLVMKKPGTGLPPERLPDVIGRRLTRAVEANQLLAAEDIEGLTIS
jgi:N-acetylneuraminate synthase